MFKFIISILIFFVFFSPYLFALDKTLTVFADINKPHGQDSLFVDAKYKEYSSVYNSRINTFDPLDIRFVVGSKTASLGDSFSMLLVSRHFQCDVLGGGLEYITTQLEYDGTVVGEQAIEGIIFDMADSESVHKNMLLNLIFPTIERQTELRPCEGSLSFIFELGNI